MGDSTLKMLGKTVVAVLVISLVLVAAMPSKKKRMFKKKEGRTDLVMKSKHHGMEIKQGACPDGWMVPQLALAVSGPTPRTGTLTSLPPRKPALHWQRAPTWLRSSTWSR